MTAKELQKMTFSQYPSTLELLKLAKTPYDLTTAENLTPQRIDKFISQACGYKLLYATQRVDDNVMKSLWQLGKEAQALDKMQHMQSGGVVNFIEGSSSENRPALHTATRDFFDLPNNGREAVEAAKLARLEIDKLKAFIKKIDQENVFTDLIMIGIGGSELGPKAHYYALEYLLKPNRKVHFIGNIDPDDVAMNLRDVNLKNALVLVISKSGTTLETTVNEEFVRSRYLQQNLEPEKHFISVTIPGSPLDNTRKYLECFHIWQWVGGRYSTTSMCGGVLLSFAFGFDVFWQILKGANAMDKAALSADVKTNLPLVGALLSIWNRNFLNHSTVAIIPYSQALQRFPAHIQQVQMESNGKGIDKQGRPVNFQTSAVIWGEPGTNAQHSFFQMIHQGTTIVPLEIIGFKESQLQDDFDYNGTTSQQKLLANLFAQAIGLATGKHDNNPNKVFTGNRPSCILLGNRLTPYSLGALLAYYENKVAFEGFIWDINSFDQEGVQLGKVLSNTLIESFRASNAPDKKDKTEPYPLGEAFLKQLDSL